MRALLMLCAVAAPTLAHADDTFEAKAAGAETITHLDDLVWLASETCERANDVESRQCHHLQDARLAQLAGKSLIVRAGTFSVAEWSSAKKSAEITLAGCLACGDGAIALDGKKFSVVASAPHNDGTVKPLYTTARPFESAAARDKLAAQAAVARVELVVKLGPAAGVGKAAWTVAGKPGITLDVQAYRVVVPCDGSVLLASPAATAVAPEPKACKH